MHNRIVGRIEENPVIAAVRDAKDIKAAVESQVTTIFLLHADIFNIKELVSRVKDSGKSVFIHIDFLEGLGKDQKAVDYIAEVIGPDGIISTKSHHIKHAKDKGLFAIQRFFMVDSQSYNTAIKTAQSTLPDMIEILPGIMPSVLKRFTSQISLPVIAGGLIDSKNDIIEILNSGALGASTGKKEFWML